MESKYLIEDYSDELLKIAYQNEKIAVVDCDLSKSFKTADFKEKFPKRHFNVGIAEQNAFGVAAGLASVGFIPFVHTFSVFASMRACEQIRSFICYPNQNVKIIGLNAGFSDCYGGATHQAVEDIGILSSIPNMTIISPCDGEETRKALREAINYRGPVYIRIPKRNLPYICDWDFKIGSGNIVKHGRDITIIGMGEQTYQCMQAAKILEKYGYSTQVVNMSTIKPIDEELIQECAMKTKGIVVAETHNVINGLGSKICSVVCNKFPSRVKIVGIKDTFTESGEYEQLQNKYNVTVDDIVSASLEILKSEIYIFN